MSEVSAPIVEAHGLHKSYDAAAVSVQALRGVDPVVEQGEMPAIIGPSGLSGGERQLDGLVVEEQRLEVPHVLASHAA